MHHKACSNLQRLLVPEALFVCSQEELRCTYYLWQLFHIDHDLTKARQQMAKESKAMEAAARSGILAEKEIDAKKKEQASFHLERIKLERHLKRRRTESDQKVTDYWALSTRNFPSSRRCLCLCRLHANAMTLGSLCGLVMLELVDIDLLCYCVQSNAACCHVCWPWSQLHTHLCFGAVNTIWHYQLTAYVP